MRRSSPYLVMLVVALAVAVSGSANGSNGYSFGQNVDPTLVSKINSAQPNNSSSSYHVLVFGGPALTGPPGPAQGPAPGLAGGPGSATSGIHCRDSDPNVGAVSATLTASQISQLSASKDVQYVVPDLPMAPTGAPGPGGPLPSGNSAGTSIISASQLATSTLRSTERHRSGRAVTRAPASASP